MEDSLQTIVVVIISVFILFIFPVYMAYEKKDDISYALAMRYTQDLVDEVRTKGYITKYMYDDYRVKLMATGNSYDINMTHEYNRHDPITNYYIVDETGKYTLVKSTTQEEKEKIIKDAIITELIDEKATEEEKKDYIITLCEQEFGVDKDNIRIEDTYQISKQVYTTNYIESILSSEKKLLSNSNDDYQYAYTMNVEDNFNVTIKNTNTTLATVIYNMVTANTLDENTRIYVNYGGTILSNKWYGDIDYAKMDHERISLSKLSLIASIPQEQLYEENKSEQNPISHFTSDYEGEYAIAFNVNPTDVTILRPKGENVDNAGNVISYNGFNFALGNDEPAKDNSTLSVSVGVNGISLITNTSLVHGASTTTSFTDFPTYEEAYSSYCPDTEKYRCWDAENRQLKWCEREIQSPCIKYRDAQRKITDYRKLELTCTTKGKINVVLTGKTTQIGNIEGTISVNDKNGILVGLNRTISNPAVDVIEGVLGNKADINYMIDIGERSISISANQEISKETTILSHPVTIDDYTNVRIHFKPKENNENIYNAMLYLNGELVDESIDLNYLPKANTVGMAVIGNREPKYFDGYISNVELYN